MRVTYIPQRIDADIAYVIEGETATATVDGQTETHDFSGVVDGDEVEITSALDPCPVLEVRRADGVMHVTLLRAVPARPQPVEYESEHDFEVSLEAWLALWVNEELEQ